MAIVLLPFLIISLPESLIKEDARLTIPAAQLFADGRSRVTILLWIVFFANLMELYILTSWLPTILSDQGVPLVWAQRATAMVQIGGIVGALALAALVDRYGPRFVLPAAFMTAVLSVATLGLGSSSIVIILMAAIGCRDRHGRRPELQQRHRRQVLSRPRSAPLASAGRWRSAASDRSSVLRSVVFCWPPAPTRSSCSRWFRRSSPQPPIW